MDVNRKIDQGGWGVAPRALQWICLATALFPLLVGCTSLLSPISGVPANRLPRDFLVTPCNNLIPIDISRLRREPPREYLLGAGDLLGVYIEGVMGETETPPPVHFPAEGSDLPPAIGYPIPISDDGTLSLPLIPPLQLGGLTLSQATDLVRKAYTVDRPILKAGEDRILLTLVQERTIRVIVMRQDGVANSGALLGSNRTRGILDRGLLSASRGQVVNLPAYKNDVLHALAETGGLPGPDAKNEIKILRGTFVDAQRRDEFIRQFYAEHGDQGPCLCAPPLPDDPAILRIPLRLPPGVTPNIRPEDIILQEGDIVLIESREAEVFYTSGLLGPGEYQMPRDYDIDVLTALSAVGTGIGSNRGLSGGGLGMGGLGGGNLAGSLGGAPPTQLFILRKTPCGGQVIIDVDLNRAIRDPAARPLIQAGDILILRYKPEEEILNFGIGTFFTFGIQELFSND